MSRKKIEKRNPGQRRLAITAVIFLLIIISGTGCRPRKPAELPLARPEVKYLGLHVLVEGKKAARELIEEIPALAARGVNLLVVEIDYNYEYQSHPELRGPDPVSRAQVKRMVELCRLYKIRLVPEFQSLGHQSWEKKTFSLLTVYPQFDETPGKYPGNQGIYCRSWCPLHPDLPPIINALYDELLEVFEADALHVGMDEVFLIADPDCPRCRGKDPAELFALAVRTAYDHIVAKRGKEMFMWGDRLLDGQATGYGQWEASLNGTHRAIEFIPRDIIICDWHYEARPGGIYPSIPLFIEQGFRVLPTSFQNLKAAEDLIAYSLQFPSDRMLGHLSTIWKQPEAGKTHKHPPLVLASRKVRASG
ncbi:MAG: family 20 glycosylhydrolase [Candidatus Saccharicenans sp.]|uniref:family 20 glycosylhydrolase n=1 Tax=Candidatus Saccharicenans sp. TaxID=2819258 RepID=UPI00404A5D42